MIAITKLTMDGTEQLYTVPKGTSSMAMHANGGAVTMKLTALGVSWTLDDKDKESIDTCTIGGQTLYFNGAAGVILEIRLLSGVL